MPENNSLKTKTISGLFWSSLDIMARQGTRFIIQIFLVRLLLPEDFGIIGMITIFIALSRTIIDSGLINALIREKDAGQVEYSTVFYFNLIMAVFLYIVLYFAAGAISGFFRVPELVAILRVLAIVLIINAFGLIQRTILIKSIDFKTQMKINLTSTVISGAIAILLAYSGFGVWSLVFHTLIMQFLESLLLSLSNRWVPSLVFSVDAFKSLFGFGWKLLASDVLNTLYRNIYYVIIGRFFSAASLGYYSNAQKLSDIASQTITLSVQKVSYPVLSSIKDEGERLRAGYKELVKNAVFITFPIMIGLAVVADPFINLLFGANWTNSIPYFQVLCLAGMLFPLHVINVNILKVKGRSDLFLWLEIIKKSIAMASIAIVLFLGFGIMGLIWMAVINSYLSYFINSYYSGKLISYSTSDQIRDIMPIFMVSVLMGIVVFVIGTMLPDHHLIKLVVQVTAGVMAYIGMSWLVKIEELMTIYGLLGSILKKV